MSENKNHLAFTKENYYIMMGGITLILIGFLVMASDSATFGFGFLGWTLGPIMVFAGFMIQFLAIFYKAKN